jgi:hypothetical protein
MQKTTQSHERSSNMKSHLIKIIPAVVVSVAAATMAVGQQPTSTASKKTASAPSVSSGTATVSSSSRTVHLDNIKVPAPQSPGNPFPKNPNPPLKNPLRDDSKNLNPRKDPAIDQGIRDNYKKYLDKMTPAPKQ